MTSNRIPKTHDEAIAKQQKIVKLFYWIIYCLPFAVVVIVGILIGHRTLLTTGLMGLFAFVMATQMLQTKIDQDFAYKKKQHPFEWFDYISLGKTSFFAGAAMVTSLILIIPWMTRTSQPHTFGSTAAYVMSGVAILILDYRLLRRGLVQRRGDQIVVHYLLRNRSIRRTDISGLSFNEKGRRQRGCEVGLLLNGAAICSVPSLRFRRKDVVTVRESTEICRALDYLSLVVSG